MNKTIKQTTFSDNDAGLGFMLYVLLSVLILAGARMLIRSGVAYTNLFYYIYAFLVEAIFALAVFIVARIKNKNMIKACGLNKKVNTGLVVLCAAVSLVCLFGLGRLSDYFMEVLTALGYKSSSASIKINTVWDLLINTLLIALLPAVCEELLFRGLILNGLTKYGKNIAIYFSAFAFMIMHGSPDQTVHQFILGVIFGYVVYYTGNLWLTILIHFFNNFFVLAATFFINVFKFDTAAEAGAGASSNETIALLISYAIGVLIVAISVYLIIACIKRIASENSKLNRAPKYLTEAEIKQFKITAGEDEQEPENADVALEEEANDGGVVVEKIGTVYTPSAIASERKDEKLNIITICMFTITTIYLAVEWLIALIGGFGG